MKRVTRRIFAPALIAFGLLGCVFKNECGYSTRYYNDCVEGYDAQGIYYKKCPHNDISNSCEKNDSDLFEECENCH